MRKEHGFVVWGLALLAAALGSPLSAQEEAKPEANAGDAKEAPASIFADPNLEAAVRKYVFEKRYNSEPITAQDVADLSTIEARGKEIKSLAGLEHCRSLALLSLPENEIEDLTPISGLKNLQLLDLSKNKIRDVAPLRELVKLQYLQLEGNRIQDITPLEGLSALTSLYLSGNAIEDIRPIAKLEKLWSLYLDGNRVRDPSPLAKLNRLSSLDLRSNRIEDLRPLAGLGELRYLFLDHNELDGDDLAVLVEMAERDAAGEKRFAPYLQVFLSGNAIEESDPRLAKLRELVKKVDYKKVSKRVEL